MVRVSEACAVRREQAEHGVVRVVVYDHFLGFEFSASPVGDNKRGY